MITVPSRIHDPQDKLFQMKPQRALQYIHTTSIEDQTYGFEFCAKFTAASMSIRPKLPLQLNMIPEKKTSAAFIEDYGGQSALELAVPSSSSEPREIEDAVKQTDINHWVLGNFLDICRPIIKSNDIELLDYDIRNWQAIDDPNWKQTILNIEIKADPDTAMKLWDQLIEELERYINSLPDLINNYVRDIIAVDVRWV
ncbi:MAG: hypothetical protein ABH833_03860 [Parcubacteria group bacterium]